MLIQLSTVLKKVLKSMALKFQKKTKTRLRSLWRNLKSVLKDEKAEASVLKEKTDALVQNSMKLGEIMYKEAQEKAEKEKKESEKDSDPKAKSGTEPKKPKKGKKDSKVVDADFEDVTEKKDSDDDNKEKSA